jgi:hypothetical protein
MLSVGAAGLRWSDVSPAARAKPPQLPQAMRRDGYRCRYCDADADCVDHIVPVCYRSDNRLVNLVAACMPCNLAASGRVFASFDAKRVYIRAARRLPMSSPAVAPTAAAEPPRGPLVTVIGAVWGEPEDDGWPLPDDPLTSSARAQIGTASAAGYSPRSAYFMTIRRCS